MTTFFSQLKLLLWKNYILRKRHIIRMILEILWPLILFLILFWVRTRGLRSHESACHLVEKTLPSVGGFPFVQNFICTLNNTCYNDFVEDGAGKEQWANATFPKMVNELTPVLEDLVGNTSALESLTNFSAEIRLVARSIVKTYLLNEMKTIESVKLKTFLVKPNGPSNFVRITTNLSLFSNPNFATELLESDVHPNVFRKESYDEAASIGFVPCNKVPTDIQLITLNTALFNDICGSDERLNSIRRRFEEQLDNQNDLWLKLVELYNLDADGVPEFAQLDFGRFQTQQFLSNIENIQRLASALRRLQEELGGFGLNGTGGNNSDGDIGTSALATMVYKGICGYNVSQNSSIVVGDTVNGYDQLRERLRDWRNMHEYEYDPEISQICNTVFEGMESRPITSVLWRQIKPFIRGKLLYYPLTNFTQKLMERVDAKFSQVKTLEQTLDKALRILHRSRIWFYTNKRSVLILQSILRNDTTVDSIVATAGFAVSLIISAVWRRPAVQAAVASFTSVDLEALDTFFERTDFGWELESDLLQCIRYKKSTPYKTKPNSTTQEAFRTEDEAVSEGLKLMLDDNLWALIVFKDVPDSNAPKHLKYKIRMDSDKVDSTRAVRDRITRKTPRRRPSVDLKYITYGFIYIQEMIEHSFIEMTTNKSLPNISMVVQQFPFPCYIFDQFIKAISNTFPLFMCLSWVYASAMLIKSIVLEKELRLKEVMKVMGCGNSVIWMAWFLDSFVVMTVSSFILSMILKYGKVIEHSEFSVIFIFLIIFSIATISFSFLVSTFFTKANSAAATGGILFFVSFLPYNFMLLWEDRLSWWHTSLSCLISNVAFGFGCTYIARLEEDGLGARWERISMRTLPGDDFSFSYCLLMLVFDSFLYFFLALYIEAVFPGENGMPRKWYFLIQKSFWYPETYKGKGVEDIGYLAFSDSTNKSVQESDPEGLVCGVSVRHLCKKYPNGRVALSDLNVSFYEGQITSFLGHNGAGKTTTISILTGLFPPSEGTAVIYGFDIRKDINVVRKDLGICPQHNVLFDRLTVAEHLEFYAGLKGKADVARMEMDQMLFDLGIPHKKADFPKNLSGGMKRKLSVAIAFVGGSRTVFLDEPTSGVDPYSRRSIWELLIKYKQGRTIILTTHFMDEADILGDRIAIISRGQLKACGTSLFLKAQFGQGYDLRLVRDTEDSVTDEVISNNISKSAQALSHRARHSEAITRHTQLFANFIQHRIPQAQLISDAGSDVIFLLPNNKVSEFQVLFHDLDENMHALKLLSYGISDTSLEDVFLQITVEDLDQAEAGFEPGTDNCQGSKRFWARVWNMRRTRRKSYQSQIVVKGSDVATSIPHLAGDTTISGDSVPRRRSVQKLREEPDWNSGSPLVPVSVDSLDQPSKPSSVSDMSEDTSEADAESDHIPMSRQTRKKSSANLFGIRRKVIEAHFWTQMWVIVLKRFRNSNRNKKAIFFEIVFPALFIALMLASTLILPRPANEEDREVSFTVYPPPNTIFYAKPPSGESLQIFNDTVNQLLGPIGLGNPCTNEVLSERKCELKWSPTDVNHFREAGDALNATALGTCSCAIGSQLCEQEIEMPPPPRMTTRTTDLLLDVTKYRVSEWILKTYFQYDPRRYGGYEMLKRTTENYTLSQLVSLLEKLTVGRNATNASTESNNSLVSNPNAYLGSHKAVYKIWYENRGWLSSTSYLNGLDNVLLRQKVAEMDPSSDLDQYGITLHTHPMNLTLEQQRKESLRTAALGVIHAICVIFALSFVPASFTVYLIEERKSGAKHLHLISGVKPVTYWISNFCFDMMKYLFSALLCLILFFAFDARAYIAPESVASFIILLILYGWAAIPLMYPASYVFGIPSTAFVILACINLFIGIITTVSTFVLDQLGDEELKEISEILQKLFLIFPHYCLGRGLIELVKLHVETAFLQRLDLSDLIVNRFEWDILGKLLVCLVIHGFIFFLFCLLIEYRQWVYLILCKDKVLKKERNVIQARIASDEDDEDVLKEEIRVTKNPPRYASLLSQNLGKIYGGKKVPAVNNLSFAVEPGECFGLLGVNGAGKSTTFKMLTGDVRITSGKAFIMGFDVEKDLDTARKHYGYCPQEDGIDPLLDAYEQLELYGRLRGLTVEEVKRTSEQLISKLGLKRYALKRCNTYSGGNKRKISTAVALIGNPDVLFLDEPTSGMDPGARRQLWKLITAVTRMGKSVVLTSHSMEECEALCSRLAIMVNGRFTCLGSLQHLKNRFGKGYRLTVRCTMENQDEFITSLETRLPVAKLEDAHCSQLKFNIPQENIRLGDIFSVMCIARTEGQIEDFSVSQTTLDDIFIKFASNQRDELDGRLLVVVPLPA